MSVGNTLAEARRAAGLSVDDVAELTCIRRTLVASIEADDFDSCGGDFYARGHVKSIAHALHLDPTPLLAEFDGEHHDPELPTATGVLDPHHGEDAAYRGERRGLNWSAVMVAALIAVLAVGGFQLASALTGDDGTPTTAADSVDRSSSDDVQPSVGGPSPDPAVTTGVPAPVVPSPLSSDAIASVPDRGVTVQVRTVGGRSWVSATGQDQGLLLQQVLDDGAAQTLSDDRGITLVIGNAGVVRLVVNGEDLGSPGGDGEVVRLRLGPDDGALAPG